MANEDKRFNNMRLRYRPLEPITDDDIQIAARILKLRNAERPLRPKHQVLYIVDDDDDL